jgi:cysteine desulfurase
LNVPGIVGIGKALTIAEKEMGKEAKQFRKWTTEMFDVFKEAYPSIMLNGHPTQRLAHNLNVCFPGIESKALIHLLKDDLSISAGSACTTTNVEPSHVLLAIGRTVEESHTAVRFGLGRGDTEGDVKWGIKNTILSLEKIRRI